MSFLSKEKVDIINQVISLSRDYQKISNDWGLNEGSLIDSINHRETEDGEKIEMTRQRLINYLETLSFEDVQVVQTVMYTGRDPEKGDNEMDPKILYSEVFSNLSWSTKEVEIKTMVGKLSLADYLYKGLKLLNR